MGNCNGDRNGYGHRAYDPSNDGHRYNDSKIHSWFLLGLRIGNRRVILGKIESPLSSSLLSSQTASTPISAHAVAHAVFRAGRTMTPMRIRSHFFSADCSVEVSEIESRDHFRASLIDGLLCIIVSQPLSSGIVR